MSTKYPIFVNVLGDGNCFYRSFMLSLMLEIFFDPKNSEENTADSLVRLIKEVD